MRDNGRVDESEYPVRLAGRVIAIDPAGRVLLFFYDDPPPKGKHWSTPGGGVEAGEDFHAAARRELVEETGWADVPGRPGRCTSTPTCSGPLHGKPTLCLQHDHYFVGRVPRGAAAARRGGGDARERRDRASPLVDAGAAGRDRLDDLPEELAELVRRLLDGQGPGTPASS